MIDQTTGPARADLGAHSTAMDVLAGIDLSGKIAIVTGGGGGIGLETTRALASAGAQVCIAARNPAAARTTADALNDALGATLVTVGQLDLADLACVRRFCAEWGDQPLHMLINNAGIMASPEGTTRDGFEVHLGANHLGHFLLAVLLTPALLRGAPARVVSLSSSGHMRSGIHFDDPHFRTRPFDHLIAYGQSKTANALFAVEFDRRHAGQGVRAFSVMPGMIDTGILRHVTTDTLKQTFGLKPPPGTAPAAPETLPPFKTAEQGAATSVWAAVAPELAGLGGLYLQDCAIAPTFVPGMARGEGVQPHALDPETARALWEFSEREVGL